MNPEYGVSLADRWFRQHDWFKASLWNVDFDLAEDYRPDPNRFFDGETIARAVDAAGHPGSPVGREETLTRFDEMGPVSKSDVESGRAYRRVSPRDRRPSRLYYPARPERASMPSVAHYTNWLEEVTRDATRAVVPITFMYHRESTLMLSIQQTNDSNYYDFSTKLFVKDPIIPRASLTYLGSLGMYSYLYGAAIGRSARLHGQYIVTIRDMERAGAVAALIAYAIANNRISALDSIPSVDSFRAERGLPAPTFDQDMPTRAGRAVELD